MWITCSLEQVFFSEVKDIKQDLLINEQIRFKEVQVIDEQGQKVGKLPIDEALDLAASKKLKLFIDSEKKQEKTKGKIMK